VIAADQSIIDAPPTVFDFSDRYGAATDEARTNTVPQELNATPPLVTYAFATKVTRA
jgi:hypothetical protein